MSTAKHDPSRSSVVVRGDAGQKRDFIPLITYAALIGMLALAGALAFGLGGRDVAAKMPSDAYASGQRNQDQVEQDLETGKARGQQQAEGRTGTGNPGGSVEPRRF